jgi:hypothetical protein
MSRSNSTNDQSQAAKDASGSRAPSPGNAQRDTAKSTHEPFIDEMVEETFPASDATQLPGRAASTSEHASATETPSSTAKKPEREPPRTIGNQGVIPASRERENSIDLNDTTQVTLRLDADRKLLQVELDRNGSVLDATAVDRLIKALSERRAQMTE